MTLQGYAKRHYTRDEIETLSARTDLDIVLTHDAGRRALRTPPSWRGLRHPGCLVAFEMKPGVREWQLLGEWPERRA